MGGIHLRSTDRKRSSSSGSTSESSTCSSSTAESSMRQDLLLESLQEQGEHQDFDADSGHSPSREDSKLASPLLSSPYRRDSESWKESLFDCFRYGYFHPALWNAICCPHLLLGQLLVRMKLTVLANRSSRRDRQSRRIIRICITLLIMMTIYDVLFAPPLLVMEFNSSDERYRPAFSKEYPLWHQLIYLLLSLPMSFYAIWIVIQLRTAMRHRYHIPTGVLGDAEDCLHVSLCNCCVLSQMARQTANYERERASCCSATGLVRRHESNIDESESDISDNTCYDYESNEW